MKIIAAIFSSIVLVMLIVFAKPGILLNIRNAKRAADYLEKKGVSVKWSNGFIDFHSKSFLEKKLDLHFDDLCIHSETVNGCFKKITTGLEFDFKKFDFKITTIGPIDLQSDGFKILPGSPKEKKEDRDFDLDAFLKKILSDDVQFKSIALNLKNLDLALGKRNIKGSLILSESDFDQQTGKWRFNLLTDLSESYDRLGIKTDIIMQGHKGFQPGTWSAEGPAFLTVGDDFKLRAQLQYTSTGNALGTARVKAVFGTPTVKFHVDVQAQREKATFQGNLHGDMTLNSWAFKLGDSKKQCQFGVTIFNDMSLACPTKMFAAKTYSIKGVPVNQFFEYMELVVDAKMKEDPSTKRWNGPIDIKILTAKNSPLKLNGGVRGKFKDSSLNGRILETITSDADLHVQVNSFQKLATQLKTTKFAVPAPFNVLLGTVRCAIKGRLDIKLDIPFNCETHLASQNQKFDLQTNGLFSTGLGQKDASPSLKGMLVLQDVQLVLPRFGLRGMPPLLPDSRFRKSFNQQKTTKPKFNYNVTIKTEKNPIRLISNLAEAPVALDANLIVVNGKQPEGMITFREFPLQLFRRDAYLKKLALEFKDKGDEAIDGEIQVRYVDYKIKIMLWGTVKEPQIRLESEPPLDQNQIVSVLLYGRTADSLDAEQSSSVSSMRGAMADKAIALSSMYLLASTPIESVGYDSQSEMFTAKVRIKEGTSLNIGADQNELKELGVKRHIKGPWYVYTYLRNPTESEARSTMALLEWIARY